MDAIVAEGLEKRYGDVQALAGVSFRVRAGEAFALLGPNGAGKSTTVKVLTTLTRPDGGRGEVAGKDIVREADAVRRSIGYVPQSSGVDRDATGRENLMLQGRVQRLGGQELRGRVDELLELVGITDAADRVVRGYSGGMKRRWTSRSGSCTGHRCCSSTSRRPASTPRPGPRCGRSSACSRTASR